MDYDPTVPGMPTALGAAITLRLRECGFTKIDHRGEDVYSRQVSPGIEVRVYTTVVNGDARGNGKDSIRVAAIYEATDGKTRGLVKNRRVHRVGNIDDIVDRMHGRMRDVWRKAARPERCGCGAPKFVTKKGNLCCAEICWVK